MKKIKYLFKQYKNTPLLWSVLTIPLHTSENWLHLQYGKKQQNQINFTQQGLDINVNNSGSPLFYPFKKTVKIRAISAKGSLTGLPSIEKNQAEGWLGIDDFPLRIGLVTTGELQFSWFQKLFLPSWLNQLLDASPEQGIGEIVFLALGQRRLASQAQHPIYEFIRQEVVQVTQQPGKFQVEYTSPKPLTVFGLWLQSDGDDSGSSFTVKLTELKVQIDESTTGTGERRGSLPPPHTIRRSQLDALRGHACYFGGPQWLRKVYPHAHSSRPAFSG